MSRILVLLLVLGSMALAACGEEADKTGERQAIAEPRLATSDMPPAARAKGRPVEQEPGFEDIDPDPPAGVQDERGGCSGADARPNPTNLQQVSSTTLCLLNAERRARGLGPLRANRLLSRAALGHARDMAARSYFSHDSRSGRSFSARIARTGYTRGRSRWTVGENIAWGTGRQSEPGSIVEAWMASPGHRANILRRDFRDIGLGVVADAPLRGNAQGATYDTKLGARSG